MLTKVTFIHNHLSRFAPVILSVGFENHVPIRILLRSTWLLRHGRVVPNRTDSLRRFRCSIQWMCFCCNGYQQQPGGILVLGQLPPVMVVQLCWRFASVRWKCRVKLAVVRRKIDTAGVDISIINERGNARKWAVIELDNPVVPACWNWICARGSLAVGFGEGKQQESVCAVTFNEWLEIDIDVWIQCLTVQDRYPPWFVWTRKNLHMALVRGASGLYGNANKSFWWL